MKKIIPALLMCLLLSSCKHALTINEKKLCGRWVTTDQSYNREWFVFKQDGAFMDNRFPTAAWQSVAQSFMIIDDQLCLRYRTLIVMNRTANYKIITQTDSTLVISSTSKKYGTKTYHLKKMKLHGKFIVA